LCSRQFGSGAREGQLRPPRGTPKEIDRVAKGPADNVVEGIEAAKRTAHASVESWLKHMLWVDDHPENNTYERRALKAVGIKFTLVLSTREASEALS
jgi:hypothetical protein